MARVTMVEAVTMAQRAGFTTVISHRSGETEDTFIADFAVAVERVVDRRLQGRPLIIAPEGSARAVVYDMSEEAYQQGVRKGMALRRARRLRRLRAKALPTARCTASSP